MHNGVKRERVRVRLFGGADILHERQLADLVGGRRRGDDISDADVAEVERERVRVRLGGGADILLERQLAGLVGRRRSVDEASDVDVAVHAARGHVVVSSWYGSSC